MATVHIPSLLRELTAGAEQVDVDIAQGEKMTVREVLAVLDGRFPGVMDRLVDEEQDDMVPGLAVFIDGEPAGLGLRARVNPEDNVFFLAPIVGGR